MSADPPILQSYLVECYWPGLTEARVAASTRRAQEAATVLSAEGTEVAHRTTLIVPDDEVAFCLFEARSAAAVEEACRRAELPFERILSVTWIETREHG